MVVSRKFFLRRFLGNRSFLDYNSKKFWTDRGYIYKEEIKVCHENPFARAEHKAKMEALIGLIKSKRVKSVFEAGVGYGLNIKGLVEEFNGRVLLSGCDFSPTQLANAKKYLGEYSDIVFLFEHDIVKGLPLSDNAFELIVCSGLLMHILPRNIDFVVSEIKRVSRRFVFIFERTDIAAGKRHYNNFVFNYNYAKLFYDWKLVFAKEFSRKHFVFVYRKPGDSNMEVQGQCD